MLFLRSGLIFILAFTSLAHGAISSNKNQKVLFDIETSRTDQKLSREFYTLRSELRRNNVRWRTLKSIKRLLPKSFAFYGFNDITDRVDILISREKRVKKFSNACPAERKPKNSTLHESFHELVDGYCRTVFASLVDRKKLKIGPEERRFITAQIDDFLKFNPDELGVILDRVERESFFFKDLNALINNRIIRGYYAPNEKILSKIAISTELTSHFQERGLLNRKAKKYFFKEFKRLSNLTERHIINDNISESKNTLSQALGFYVENKKYISSHTAWRYLTLVADEYRENGHKDLSLDTLDKILAISGPKNSGETIFKMLTTCLNFSDSGCAKRIINKYQLVDTLNDYDSKVKFWVGRSLELIGEKSKAMEVYSLVSKESPLDFYSILASRQLSITQGNKTNAPDFLPINITASALLKQIPQNKLSKDLQRSLARTSLWLDNEIEKFVVMESADILELFPSESFNDENLIQSFGSIEFKRFLVHQLVQLYNHKKQYLLTFKLVYRSIEDNIYDLTNKSLKFLFPLEYMSKIQAIDPDVDPLLILSLIRQESAFNPKAKSRVGARGLMQLMPQTARRFKKRVKAYQLKKPKLNLKIGIKYFNKLLKRYDGNLIYTLAAYNAGEGRVKRWRREVFKNPDPLLTIENIPFKETRNYVKYIYRNLYLYRVISDNTKQFSNINDTFVIKTN